MIAPEIPNTNFGREVAISGDVLITADYSKDALFVYNNINGSWEYSQTITPDDATGDKSFGWHFSISGNTIMVGASNDIDDLGAVYFFEKNGTGQWNQTTKITSPVPSSPSSDAYWRGRYINVNGSVATATRNNGLNSQFHVLGKTLMILGR